MRVAVIGTGYLGAVHAAGMAHLGFDTVGVDVDEAKVAALQSGTSPFYEPGFDPILAEQVASGRLRFSTDFSEISDADVVFIGVGTPQKADSHAADLTYIDSAIASITPHLKDGALVAVRGVDDEHIDASFDEEVGALP